MLQSYVCIQGTGKRKLIIAGVVTDVCVTFVALAALAAGYEAYVVTDCSGTFSKDVRDAAMLRMTAAGAHVPHRGLPFSLRALEGAAAVASVVAVQGYVS